MFYSPWSYNVARGTEDPKFPPGTERIRIRDGPDYLPFQFSSSLKFILIDMVPRINQSSSELILINVPTAAISQSRISSEQFAF